MRKRLFIIDAYPSGQKEYDILERCIESIKPLGYDIMIVSHLPIKESVAKSVNYCIYDHNNTFLLPHYTPFWWMRQDGFTIKIFNAGHTLPICRNMNTSISMAKCLKYDEFIFMEADVVFNLTDLMRLREIMYNAFDIQNKKMLFFRPEEYRDCEGSYVYETLLFAGNPDFFLETFTPPLNLDEWLAIPMGYTLELSFYERFSHKESEYFLVKDHSSNAFNNSEVNLSRYGLFNCELVYNESNENEPMLFIMNSLINPTFKYLEVFKNGELIHSMNLGKSHYWFRVFDFDESLVKVDVYDNVDKSYVFLSKEFTLSKSQIEIYKEKGTIKFN